MPWSQSRFDIRCEFGPRALDHFADSDVFVIVDVLSFTTAVSVATDRDARITPFLFRDERARDHARALGASLAGRRDSGARYTLSPATFLQATPGERIVVPSPNGATLATRAPVGRTYAGCLRNARAVAERVRAHGGSTALVPAGERWTDDDSLRPCIEDWIGAGAIAALLPGTRSPEADLAVAAWERARERGVHQTLSDCASGLELAARGYADDVRFASERDASPWAPVLRADETGTERWFGR